MDSAQDTSQVWASESLASQTPRGFLPGPTGGVDSLGSSSFCGYPSTTHFIKDLRKKMVDLVDTAEKLPQGEMNYLVCSTYGDFVEKVSVGSSQITSMMKNLSHYWGIPAATCRQFDSHQNKLAVMQGIQETIKQLKERMDLTLDELARLKDDQSAVPVPGVSANGAIRGGKARFAGRIAGIARPQVAHGWKIDNSRNPFVPHLSVKHHALRALDLSMADPQVDGKSPHPYQFELDLFETEESRLEVKPAIPAKKTDEVPLSYIDTLVEFQRALLELSSVKEMAVDLEHHSYRTYLGITCLIQISSRLKDYIIDTIALREHIHELNATFTNPKILKVFHGGNMDIQWLQRDFGVYVVNMFDTGQASRVLQLARFSFAFLVQHYMGRIVDKTHQTSDWRIRPIPDDMLAYARSDTHDLLYLYDCLRNDLIKKDPTLGMIQQVYVKSKEICLQRYEKQTTDVNDFVYIMVRFAKNFSEPQKFALKRILEWRDDVARDLDESIGFVLPTKACVDLAEELPRTADDLVKSLEFVPVVLKQRIHQMLDLLREARAFTGVVPVPVSEIFTPMEVDSISEVIQRKIVQPLTAEQFVSRYSKEGGRTCSSELVWVNNDRDVARVVEDPDPDAMRLAHIWMHYQTTAVSEEEIEKAKPKLALEKPNVKVSVPMELPLAEAVTRSKEDVRIVRSDHNGSVVKHPPVGSKSALVIVAACSERQEMASSSSDILQLPTKRPAFDYQSADYSKFSVGASPAQKRHAGKQHPGGLKDPNKRFNQQRNMSSDNSAKSSGGRFRKPE